MTCHTPTSNILSSEKRQYFEILQYFRMHISFLSLQSLERIFWTKSSIRLVFSNLHTIVSIFDTLCLLVRLKYSSSVIKRCSQYKGKIVAICFLKVYIVQLVCGYKQYTTRILVLQCREQKQIKV